LAETFGTVADEPAAALSAAELEGALEPLGAGAVDEVVAGLCPDPARIVGPEPASMLLIVFWIPAISSLHGPAQDGLSPIANRALEARRRYRLLVIVSSLSWS
jgi:hypothetical protein